MSQGRHAHSSEPKRMDEGLSPDPLPEAPRPDGKPSEGETPLPVHPAEPAPVTGAQRALGATLGRPRPRGRAGWALAILAAALIIIIPLGVFAFVGRPGTDAEAGRAQVPAVSVPADAPISEALEVAGRLGSVPVLTLKGRLTAPSTLLTDTLITGQGREIAAGDGIVLSVATFSGTTGANTTGTETGHRLYRGVLEASSLGEELADAVTGAHEGSRLVLRSVAEDGSGAEVTVVDVLPTLASGTQARAPEGLPAVTLGDDGTMTVSLEGVAAPTEGSTTVLIAGKGEQIQPGATLIARYTVVAWPDGSVRSSSYGWSTAPAVMDLRNTLSGLAQRLTDVTVGSRVLVMLPADQARGDAAIAVVVDVLAIADDATLGSPASPSPTPEAVQVEPSAIPTVTSGS